MHEDEEPFPGYVNRLSKMTKLNDNIREMNKANGTATAPLFHMYGIRTDPSKSKKRREDSHRFEMFRESESHGDQVHFKDKVMARVGQAVGRYFVKM